MREHGLCKSRYHNLRRSIPAVDVLLDLLKTLGATRLEIIEILGLSEEPQKNPVLDRNSESKKDEKAMQAMMGVILEVRDEVRAIKETSFSVLLSSMTETRLTEMIDECIADKTERELKEQMEFICPEKLNWEIFQAIAKGIRKPKNLKEIQEIKAIVDPENPGKYHLREWFAALMALTPNFKVRKLEQPIPVQINHFSEN